MYLILSRFKPTAYLLSCLLLMILTGDSKNDGYKIVNIGVETKTQFNFLVDHFISPSNRGD